MPEQDANTSFSAVPAWALQFFSKMDAIHQDVNKLTVGVARLDQAEVDVQRRLEAVERTAKQNAEYIARARGAVVAAGTIAGTVGGVVVFLLQKVFG